jgi:hypothetical protein
MNVISITRSNQVTSILSQQEWSRAQQFAVSVLRRKCSVCDETEKPLFRANAIRVECAVSALRDIDWSPGSFDCLQIPSNTKTMLLSLAKMRLGLIPTVPFDDVINAKGQGLNMLLKYVGKCQNPSKIFNWLVLVVRQASGRLLLSRQCRSISSALSTRYQKPVSCND